MMLSKKPLLLLLLLLLASFVGAQGFLRADGKKIVEGNGNEIILRGMGLGGWMLQEGYMMQTSGFANTQHALQNTITSLIGEEKMQAFYTEWRANHCTKADVDSLKAWGFNSIRLPMHYNLYTLPIEKEPVQGENTWLTEGFRLTDSLLKWCGENEMYLILDLHAAPGGQGKDAAISDYDPSKPSLWESEINKHKMIALWVKLAERYKDEPWMGAYDIINEPNWSFTAGGNQNGCSENSNAPLRKLLKDVTEAIRTVDTNHIVIIEGNCWGNNYNGIFPLWDDNMVLSFHKYWSDNNQGSINGIMQLRNQYNVPIWCGESGENSNVWFTEAIRLFESNNIGWAWWPMKKIGSVVGPLTIPKDPGYETLLNYWANGGTKPTVDFAFNALRRQAQNSNIANCISNKDVIDAMFRQIYDPLAVPFSLHTIPGLIHFTDFDLGRSGSAYSDKDTANYQVSSGVSSDWNYGWSYRNDAVDIAKIADNDPNGNGFYVGWTQRHEWLQYTINVDSSALYSLKIRYSNSSGKSSYLRCILDDTDITALIELKSTGVSSVWNTVSIDELPINKGRNQLKFYIQEGGADLSYAHFDLQKPLSQMVAKPIIAAAKSDEPVIEITFNKDISSGTVSIADFEFKINGQISPIRSLSVQPGNNRKLDLGYAAAFTGSDALTITYKGNKLAATDGSLIAKFNDFPVINDLPKSLLIPGKLEAEDFEENSGLKLEATTDAGGGYNIGFTNPGDFLLYRVQVEDSGKYEVIIREACFNDPGKIEIQQLDLNKKLLNSATVDMTISGGWQSWQDITTQMPLNSGPGFIKIKILDNEFNLNWFKFNFIKSSDSTTGDANAPIYFYPNPAQSKFKLVVPNSLGYNKVLNISDIEGRLVSRLELPKELEIYDQTVDWLDDGVYIIEVNVENRIWRKKMLKI